MDEVERRALLDSKKRKILDHFGVSEPLARAIVAFCKKHGTLAGSRGMGAGDHDGSDWDYVVRVDLLNVSGYIGVRAAILKAIEYTKDESFQAIKFFIGDDFYDVILTTKEEELVWKLALNSMQTVLRVYPMREVCSEKSIRTSVFEGMKNAFRESILQGDA